MKYYGKIINDEDVVNKQYVDENIPTKTSDLENDSGFIDENYHDSTKQNTLVSGSNIKTINNQSILGGGNISISTASDGITIDTNTNNELQAIGVIDAKTAGADKFWTGTRAEYNAISVKDSNTFYHITDDVNNFVREAASDNKIYGRSNEGWVAIGSSIILDQLQPYEEIN